MCQREREKGSRYPSEERECHALTTYQKFQFVCWEWEVGGGGGGGGSLRLASHLWVGTVIDIHSVITVYDHCSL